MILKTFSIQITVIYFDHSHFIPFITESQFDKTYANKLQAIRLQSGPVILFLEAKEKKKDN